MKYEYSESLQVLVEDVCRRLFPHIETGRIKCLRSYESGIKSYVRCHALSDFMRAAMEVKQFYALEFISENFNNLDIEKKVRAVISSLMKIPRGRGRLIKFSLKDVDLAYKDYLECRRENKKMDWFKERGFR